MRNTGQTVRSAPAAPGMNQSPRWHGTPARPATVSAGFIRVSGPGGLPHMRRDHEDHRLHRAPPGRCPPQESGALRTPARPAAKRTAPTLAALPRGIRFPISRAPGADAPTGLLSWLEEDSRTRNAELDRVAMAAGCHWPLARQCFAPDLTRPRSLVRDSYLARTGPRIPILPVCGNGFPATWVRERILAPAGPRPDGLRTADRSLWARYSASEARGSREAGAASDQQTHQSPTVVGVARTVNGRVALPAWPQESVRGDPPVCTDSKLPVTPLRGPRPIRSSTPTTALGPSPPPPPPGPRRCPSRHRASDQYQFPDFGVSPRGRLRGRPGW